MPLINKNRVLFFETDQEFENFALVSHYTSVGRRRRRVPFGEEYSEAYKECINQGKYFVIGDGRFGFSTNRRGRAGNLPVKNIGYIFADMTFYMIVFDGQNLNPNEEKLIRCSEAAELIVNKWTELYGNDVELSNLAKAISDDDDNLLEELIKKACEQESFKEKLEVTPLVNFMELTKN